jgi:hypothetical protein
MKFPRVCGHCTKSECGCNPFEIDKQTDKAGKYKELYQIWKTCRNLEFSMSDWVFLFANIFGGRIYLSTMENIGFHFLEEAGEEAQAIRGLAQMRGVLDANIEGIDAEFLERISDIAGLVDAYEKYVPKDTKSKVDSNEPSDIQARLVKSKMDLIIEFADTFSWFCAILFKLNLISQNLENSSYDFEEALELEYGVKGQPLKCPTCKSEDCCCVFFPFVSKKAE